MNVASLVSKVISRVKPGATEEERDALEFDVRNTLKQALEELGRRVAAHPDEEVSRLLRKEFEVKLTAGVGDLTEHKAAAEPLLVEALRRARATHADVEEELEYLLDYGALREDRNELYGYFAAQGVKLGTRAPGGVADALAALGGTLTLFANCIPLIERVGRELEGELVEISAQLVAPAPKEKEPRRREARRAA